MNRRREFGRESEEHASKYLQSKGYEILARNYRTRWGEVDIIGKINGSITFIEVKARSSIYHGYPREAVTPAKQARITQAAQSFLYENGLTESPARFDVIEIYSGNIVHWRNAFDAME